MAKDLDDQVQAFLLPPIEQAIPCLFVDASYYKIRDGARYVTKAAPESPECGKMATGRS